MFERLRQSWREALQGGGPPEARRAALAQMRDTLVQARLGVEDLRGGVESTRARLAAERRELETVQRRKRLATEIKDGETVALAERYERQHAERAAVLERKLEAQTAELALVEREVESMTAELKLAAAGGSPGSASGVAGAAAHEVEADGLRDQLDGLARSQARAAREATAEEQLAALKRKMGK